MADKILPFMTGSEDRVEGWCYDNVAGSLVAIDLSGASVKLRWKINGRTAVERTGVPDGNQVLNKGKFTYDLLPNDITQEGTVELSVHVTIAGQVHKSQIVLRSSKLAV